MTKKRPIPKIETLSKESQYLYDVINGEQSDLACALVATSYLDHALASLLLRHFTEDNSAHELLDRALSNFGARSTLAHCLGMITEAFYHNLTTIGDIRNRFAHRYGKLSFEDNDIGSLVDSLRPPTIKSRVVVGANGAKQFGPEPLTIRGDRRAKYSLLAVMMFNTLILTGLTIEHIKKQTKGWE